MEFIKSADSIIFGLYFPYLGTFCWGDSVTRTSLAVTLRSAHLFVTQYAPLFLFGAD